MDTKPPLKCRVCQSVKVESVGWKRGMLKLHCMNCGYVWAEMRCNY